MKHPGARSLALGMCLCLLYVGYELARACSLAMFARSGAADGLNWAYTTCGSFLLSVATLAVYGRCVEVFGEGWTLLLSAGGCSVVFLAFAAGLSACEGDSVVLVAGLFAFRESYVTLIGTQVWALLSAELKHKGPKTSRCWFCLFQVRPLSFTLAARYVLVFMQQFLYSIAYVRHFSLFTGSTEASGNRALGMCCCCCPCSLYCCTHGLNCFGLLAVLFLL